MTKSILNNGTTHIWWSDNMLEDPLIVEIGDKDISLYQFKDYIRIDKNILKELYKLINKK